MLLLFCACISVPQMSSAAHWKAPADVDSPPKPMISKGTRQHYCQDTEDKTCSSYSEGLEPWSSPCTPCARPALILDKLFWRPLTKAATKGQQLNFIYIEQESKSFPHLVPIQVGYIHFKACKCLDQRDCHVCIQVISSSFKDWVPAEMRDCSFPPASSHPFVKRVGRTSQKSERKSRTNEI